MVRLTRHPLSLGWCPELALATRDQQGTAEAALGFAGCYAHELPGLVWFVMSLGASAAELR